jgi:hypothetical protein
MNRRVWLLNPSGKNHAFLCTQFYCLRRLLYIGNFFDPCFFQDGIGAAHKADPFGDGNTGTDYTYNGFLASDKNEGL